MEFTYYPVEQVFFNCGYPMLFSCRSNEGKLYLVLCPYRKKDGIRWLLKETSPSIIIDMLTDKITLREAFLVGPGEQISLMYKYKSEKYITDNKYEKFLPDNEYIEAEENEFNEEISFYSNLK